MKTKVREYFKAHREEIQKNALHLLSELVKQKTVNVGKDQLGDHPYLEVPGDESKAVEVLSNYLNKAGFSYNVYEQVQGRGNIIATYGRGKTSLCLGCHLDVVPAGDPAAWNTDPFVMTEKDGKVFGRGTMDNKGQAVASVMAMELLKNAGIKLHGKLLFAGLAGEEYKEKGEMDPGFEYITSKGYLKPTYAIIPDIGEHMKNIDIAEKGRIVFKVKSIGKQAHGSTPELGINAIFNLAQFLKNAEKIKLTYTPHDVLKQPSVNLGIVKGGAAANIVPNSAEATFDVRYLPGQNAETIFADFKKCEAGIENGKFEYEIESNMPPHQISADNILVKAIQANAKELLGFTPDPIGQGGGTFAKGFCLAGIQAVGFGPGDADVFHVANEYLEIEEMMKFIELIACISCDILGAE